MRANKTSKIDEVEEGLLNLHSQAKTLDNNIYDNEYELEDVKNVEMISCDKCLEPYEMKIRQETGICNRNTVALLGSEPSTVALQQNERSIRFARSTLEFKNVKGFNSFARLSQHLHKQ